MKSRSQTKRAAGPGPSVREGRSGSVKREAVSSLHRDLAGVAARGTRTAKPAAQPPRPGEVPGGGEQAKSVQFAGQTVPPARGLRLGPATPSGGPSAGAAGEAGAPSAPIGSGGAADPQLGLPAALPFREKMEASFGQPLEGIAAFTGPEAQAAARARGTAAFTVGQKIAFADARPSELVVAHEVTHAIQQRQAGAPVGLLPYGGPLTDPLEREADAVAHAVVAGQRVEVTGEAPGAPVQNYSGWGVAITSLPHGLEILLDILAPELRSVLRDKYDPAKNRLEAILFLKDALAMLGLFFPKYFGELKAVDTSTVYLLIDFAAGTITISPRGFHSPGLVHPTLKTGAIDLDFMVTIHTSPGFILNLTSWTPPPLLGVDISVSSLVINNLHFEEYKVGYDKVHELDCDRITVPAFSVTLEDAAWHEGLLSLSSADWLLKVRLYNLSIQGLRYPGLPPTNFELNGVVGITLDGIGTVIPGGDSDSGMLGGVPSVFPKDSHIAISVKGPRGILGTGSSHECKGFAGEGGFESLSALVVGADGKKLASVTIEDFHFKADPPNLTTRLGHFAASGAPAMVDAVLRSAPLYNKTEPVIEVLEKAGINPAVDVDLDVRDVKFSTGPDGGSAAADRIAGEIAVAGAGSVLFSLAGANVNWDAESATAAFEFTATLLSPTKKEAAYVRLARASGSVAVGENGVSAGGGSVAFDVRGNVTELVNAMGTRRGLLPKPVRQILPMLERLGLKAEISGKVVGAGGVDAGVAIVGDLSITLTSPIPDCAVLLKLQGLGLDQKGAVAHADFTSFEASLVHKGKKAASVVVKGGSLESIEKKEGEPVCRTDAYKLVVPSIVVNGNASDISAIANALRKYTTELPAKVRAICNLVADHVVAANAKATFSGLEAVVDDAGNARLEKGTLKAEVYVAKVGALSVEVAGLHSWVNTKHPGPAQFGFKRLDLALRHTDKKKAVSLSVDCDLETGDELRLKINRLHVEGDAQQITLLLKAARENLRILPEPVQQALEAVPELLGATGDLTLEKFGLELGPGAVHVKGDLESHFDLAGLGRVTFHLKGFLLDATKTQKAIHFDRFDAKLEKLDEKAQAKIEITRDTPAEAAGKAADAPNATIKTEGQPADRKLLFESLLEHAQLPGQVRVILGTALEAIASGTTMSVESTSPFTLRADGDAVVARGDFSATVDVPEVGQVELRLIGRDGKAVNDPTGFKSLSFVVNVGGQAVAGVDVVDGVVDFRKGSTTPTGFRCNITAWGDVDRIRALLDEKRLPYLPAEAQNWLKEIKPTLEALGTTHLGSEADPGLIITGVSVREGKKLQAEKLEMKNVVVDFSSQGKTYRAEDVVATFTKPKIDFDAKNGTEITAPKMHGKGYFSYADQGQSMAGAVSLDTDAITASIGANRKGVKASNIRAQGMVFRWMLKPEAPSQPNATGTPTPAPTDAKAPAPTEAKPASGPTGAQATPAPAEADAAAGKAELIEAGAALLQDLRLNLSIPIAPGRYGGFKFSINVPKPTSVSLILEVKDGAVRVLDVGINPAIEGVVLRALPVSVSRVKAKIDSREAAIRTVDYLVKDAIVNGVAPTAVRLATKADWMRLKVNLPELARQIQANLAAMPASDSAPRPDNDTSEVGDLVTKGLKPMGISGTAFLHLKALKDLTIAGVQIAKDSSVELWGSSDGSNEIDLRVKADLQGTARLGDAPDASSVAVAVKGLDSGTIESTKRAVDPGTKPLKIIDFKGLSIDELDLGLLAPQKQPASAPVQQKHGETDPGLSDREVREWAARGIAEPGGSLPYREVIQAAFGRHDISGVAAHVGGGAANALGAMGARAYTSGEHVAFSAPPDVRLAAHEAAHVIQQRHGVTLAGGVGRPGDEYERQADQVADVVVARGSAERLLDQAGAARGPSRAVQMEEGAAAAPVSPARRPAKFDLKSLGIDVASPRLDPALLSLAGLDQERVVGQWVAAHRADVLLATSMKGLVHRIRTEMGQRQPALLATSDEQLRDWVGAAAAVLNLPLPKDDLPVRKPQDAIRQAVSSGMSIDYALSITEMDGQFKVVALGKTPRIPRGGAQLLADTSGVTLASRDAGSGATTALQATYDPGVKFSTSVGPVVFAAGIDCNKWEISLSLGPEVPDLSALSAVFRNTQDAIFATARGISASGSRDLPGLYTAAIKPHLPAIKEAVAAVGAAAALKPGQVSFGAKVSGPGYAPYAAEGAVSGVTAMATLTVVF